MGYADAVADFPVFGLPSAAYSRSISNPSVQRILDAVSGEMDGYFGARVPTLPIPPPIPPVVAEKCCRIGAWRVLQVIGFNPESTQDAAVKAGMLQAMKWLEDIREGVLVPPFLATPVAQAQSDTPRGWYPEPCSVLE